MKWGELSITDLKSLYDHAQGYTVAAKLAKQNGQIDTRSEKDKQWHQHWQKIQLNCAKRLAEISQTLEV